MQPRWSHPVESLRRAVIALERQLAREAVGGAVEGAREELVDSTPELGEAVRGLLEQVDALVLQVRLGMSIRQADLRSPGRRARLAAREMVRGASSGLHHSAARIAEDARVFEPTVERLTEAMARGLARGIRRELLVPATWRLAGLTSALSGLVLLAAGIHRFGRSGRSRWT